MGRDDDDVDDVMMMMLLMMMMLMMTVSIFTMISMSMVTVVQGRVQSEASRFACV